MSGTDTGPAPAEDADAEGERDYSSLGRRFYAALIDNAIWIVGFVAFAGPAVSALETDDPTAAGLVVLVYLSLWFNYFALCEWRWGQTIGKNVAGIRVEPLRGEGIGFGAASMRNLLRLVDWFVIGWILIATDDRKQRLGDMAAGTVVVPKRRSSPVLTAAGIPALAAAADSDAGADGETGLAVGGAPGEDPEAADRGRRGTLPEINWTLGNTIRGLFAGMLLAILTPILVLPFDPDLDSNGSLLAAQALFGLTLLVFPLGNASGWSLAGLREAPRRLGLRRFALSAFGWALLAMFAYYLFAGLFAALVVQPEQEDIGGQLGVGDENLLVALSAVILIVGLAPIAEETFFRGFVFSGLRSRLALWPAALLSGLVFGLPHVTTGVTTVVPLAVFGVALAWLYEKTGSLWPPVIVHAINNGFALALLS